MKKVFIKNKKRKEGEFQFFMHQFIEAWIKSGSSFVSEYSFFVRSKIATLAVYITKFLFLRISSSKATLVCSSGSSLLYNSVPYCFFTEIIPMLWDCWPGTWPGLFRTIRILKCKICFVTSSQVAELLKKEFPTMKVFWIPEGIDIKDYDKGSSLSERPYELYELGRQFPIYHDIIVDLYQKGEVTSYFANECCDNKFIKLVFKDAESLLENLRKIKIVVSFPQIDTHPQKVGNIETLTQRYWESMLSRNLIIGRAPKELIDLIGYDPVVNVNWENPRQQLIDILANMSSYQNLVDKNYQVAIQKASWDLRIIEVKNHLKDDNYKL